ncbi:putative ribonuclease H-like domain-containing protein [Tanacetum coccineum]|uniref:Ribonuclease H-like domain-containing protein n=1 Tax=Tanacetum coccineum TaxID=301880 RepID=A0ABQ4YR16_9ASTR
MTGNYMPSGPEIEIDYSQFTYGPKQTQPSESESQSSESDTCESNISTEPSELVSELVVNESNVECQPKVWSDAPIIEEYESDSDDECVSIPTKQQETPSFANQQVKTPRENVKSQNTHSQKPKVDKKDLGYGFAVRACFVCGSLNHLIRDCDFHEKRMARKADLNNGWNNVQRVNKQNQFVPSAVLTRTGKIPVSTARASSTKNFSTARQSFNRQTVLTNTAMKVNTVKQIVNRVRPTNVFHKTHSPSTRPFKKTTVLRPKFSNQKLNTAKDYPHRALKNKGIVDSGCSRHMTGNKAYLAEFQDFNGGPVAFGGSKGYITGKGKQHKASCKAKAVSTISHSLQLLHMDLFGPTSVRSLNHKTYCLVITDDFSRTLIEAARTMLADSFLPNTFWAEAVSTACYVLNRVLVTKPHNKTPYELLTGKGPTWLFDLDYLTDSMNYHPVSSENQANIHAGQQEANQNAGTEEIIDAGDSDKEDESAQDCFVLPIWPSYSSTITPALTTDDKREGPRDPREGLSLANPTHSEEDDSEIPPLEDIYQNSTDGIFTTSSYDDEGAVADFTNLETVVNVSPIPTSRIHSTHPKALILGDPNLAVQTRSKKVWVLVDLPYGKKAIGTKWVYRNKKDERGVVVYQEERIDYDEVFALVARLEAIRIFLAFTSYIGFIVYQMDVKSVFLYGKIDEEVYVYQPPGFLDPKYPQKVYKVVKALYGLHQAPRAWYATLSTFLLKNGYRRGTIDKTLFLKKDKHDIILVQVYVDDIIFGSTKKSWCDEFEALMKSRFQMSSMGELTFFLRLQVKQKEDGIFISQDKYVAEILKKFDFANVKTASTPIETQKPLVKDEEASDVDVHLYRSMIGSLMYLTASRPDIMFAVCACSRFQVTPKSSHLSAVKRIFRYLKGKPKLGLWYPKVSSFDLESYSDSDYAGANLDRKSTIGGCQFLGRRLISWQCKKQTIVATSTTEAEYVAAASCCGQVLWIQNQMLDYGFNFMNTKIYIDNESTICIVKNPVYHSKTKHIAIRHHFIRDAYEKKLIQVLKIHTDDNVADLLTKAFDVSSKMDVLDSCPKHNMVAYLEKFKGNAEFHEILDFLKRSTIHHALTVSPIVSTTFVEQFWTSAKSKTINNVRHITAKYPAVNTIDVTVPLDHFPVNTLTSKVFSFMIKKGKHFSGAVTPLFATMLVQPTQDEGASSERPSEAQPTPSPAPTSEVPYEPQTDSSPAQTSEVPIEHQPNPSPRPSPTTTIPDSIPETSGENLGGHSSSDKSLSGNEGDMTIQSVYDLCLSLCTQVSDQAKEIQALKAQITKLKKQAKHVIKYHKAYLKSVSLKQRLPRKSFSKKHRVHKESVSKQGRKFAKGESSVQRDPLFDEMPEDTVDHMETENAQNEGRTREMVDEDKEIDENILSTEDVLSTDKEEQVEGIDEQIKGTEEHMSESDGIPEAEKKFKQLESDEEMARKIQEEWEAEEERNRIAKEKAANEALIRNFDDIKARIEADRLLAEKLQEQEREQFTIEERAKFLHDTIAAQRKFLAQQRSEAIRNRPPTKNQLRNQMMSYLKHVGNFKHAELKIKKFEEVQTLYEKIKRSDEDFISIGSAEDERLIKKMNEKGVDSSKDEMIKEQSKEEVKKESKEEVQEESKEEESKKKRKLGTRKKMKSRKRRYIQNTSEDDSDKENDELRLYLTIAPDEEKEVDYEILDRKYPIKEWKTECLGTKPQTNQAEDFEEINLNVVTRSNGQKRYFSTLMTVLSIFDREDPNAVYQLVMDKYQDEMPEGFDRVLWGDLMVMFNSDNKNEFWSSQLDWIIYAVERVPLRKEVLMQMLKLKLESEEDRLSTHLASVVKSWLVHDQTVHVGKLSRYTSNPDTYHCGWVFLLNGGAISWPSKKQTCITSSIMESEFVALAAISKEAEWLRNLILEIPLWSKPIAPISIRCDNAATLAKAYSQMYNGKSRHLGMRHNMIRELIMNGVVSIEFVRSQQNLADHLMKGLARDLVLKSDEMMGLKFNLVVECQDVLETC